MNTQPPQPQLFSDWVLELLKAGTQRGLQKRMDAQKEA